MNQTTQLCIQFLRDMADILEKDANSSFSEKSPICGILLFDKENGPTVMVPEECVEWTEKELNRGIIVDGYSKDLPS